MIDDKLRNQALKFSLEWGPERSVPLLEKMRRIDPGIDENMVKELEKLANEIQSFAWRQFEAAFAKQITESQAAENIRKQYPFVSSDNLSHLQTQGMYYAWKG